MVVGMVDPGTLGWSTLSGAGLLYKNRIGIRTALAWLGRKILGRKIRIAVTGPAGVGKTVLVDALTPGRMDGRYKPPGQSDDVERRKQRVSKKRFEFIVLPGQDARKRVEGENDILEKPVDGIIYAVCSGFATFRDDVAKRQLVASGQDTLSAFREAQRRSDLDHLEHTTDYVRRMFVKHSKPTWMLVAVTKFDLLYAENAEVLDYYSPNGSSPFVDKMKALHGLLGADVFAWSSIPVVSHPEEFSWNGTQVQPQLSLADRAESVNHFFARVERHCG